MIDLTNLTLIALHMSWHQALAAAAGDFDTWWAEACIWRRASENTT